MRSVSDSYKPAARTAKKASLVAPPPPSPSPLLDGPLLAPLAALYYLFIFIFIFYFYSPFPFEVRSPDRSRSHALDAVCAREDGAGLIGRCPAFFILLRCAGWQRDSSKAALICKDSAGR